MLKREPLPYKFYGKFVDMNEYRGDDDDVMPSRVLNEKDRAEYEKEKEHYESRLRMYVLVRRDQLPINYCIPQASHAVAEYVHYHNRNKITKQWVEQDKTMIVLEANADQMERMKKKFKDLDKRYSAFYEPDLDNMLTAIAFEPVTRIEGAELFDGLKLVK